MKMMMKRMVLVLLTSALLSGCNKTNSSSIESEEEPITESSLNSSESSSSSVVSQSDDQYHIDPNQNHNPKNCQNHNLKEQVLKEATLLEKGVKNYTCSACQCDFNDYYYDFAEFVFDDMTFMHDGNEHQVLIDGVLPYGVTVKYENNALTEIGSKEATAKFYEGEKLLLEKKAKINIVENIGIPNIKIITTDGQDPDWETKEYKSMSVSIDNCDTAFVKTKVPGEIKVRGNSTNQKEVAKRAWRLKLSGKTNLLGLNNGIKEKSWVLLADFFDQSMFRNASAFSMGNALFNYSGFYSSDFKHVNVYMNDDYRGVYLLTEQQQAKKERIPIYEAEEGVTTTKVGYLVEIDGLVSQQGQNGTLEGDPCFTTGSGNSSGGWGGWGGWGGQGGDSINGVNITDKGYVIKTDTWSDEQIAFIKKYINNVLTAFKDLLKGEKNQIVNEEGELVDSPYKTQYETLNAYIDIDSFFRMFVLQEFMKNYDVGWGSFYFYVDFSTNSKVKRFTMGAPWDFDLSSGNKTDNNMKKTNDDFLLGKSYTSGMTTFNPWLYMLGQTDFFKDMIKKYYSIFNNSGIYDRMMNYVNYEVTAFATDFNNTYKLVGLPNASGSKLMNTQQHNTHKDAVDYLVKWYKARKTYLDSVYLK